ncbi:Atu1372/SO_1960 family protein [Paenibacillus sp. FA6]|uniref:Atu1372/SO_1960 family protein n=1 Tax=Paenibacillus sp. FA6 TaxID=3413029 RepID=UPI003F655698
MSQIVQIIIEQMNAQLERIEDHVNRLSEEDVWSRLEPDMNSVANLCIHLAGSEYQHFVSGMGNKPFIRERSQEFDRVGGYSKKQLIEQLHAVRRDSIQVLKGLTDEDLQRQVKVYFEPEDWNRMKGIHAEHSEPCVIRSIQSHLVYIAEHIGYHTGQIVLMTKLLLKGSVEARLDQLKIVLPSGSEPAANYMNYSIVNGLLFVSGKGPAGHPKGKLGSDFSTEEGYQFARQAGIEVLAVLNQALGSLNKVNRVIKVQGFVNASPQFDEHHVVLNGFSDLMREVFGEKGVHARSVMGANSLRGNLPLVVDSIFEVDASHLTS